MKKIHIILICCFVLILTTVFSLKNVFMSEFFYANNSDYGKDVNDSVKSVVLDSVKERCSLLYKPDKTNIYSANFIESVDWDEQSEEIPKSVLCIIDADFMKTLQQVGENQYRVIVKARYPEDCYYEITIKKEADQYLITSFLVDI